MQHDQVTVFLAFGRNKLCSTTKMGHSWQINTHIPTISEINVGRMDEAERESTGAILSIVSCFYSKHSVSETGFCLRLQVKPTELGPVDSAGPYRV
jgi:hypothetical protein